jgi:DNA repair exonuclease SbcCD ATPase subunit
MARKRFESRVERETDLRRRFELLKAERKPTTVAGFARDAGIDRTYLYNFPALAAEISAYARKTQPAKSRRAGRLSRTAARAGEIDARIRREHARWSGELPKLRQELEKAKARVKSLEEHVEQLERVRTAYGLLMMLATEAGVSPVEIERLQTKALS